MEATFSPVYAVGAGLSQADPEVVLLTDIVPFGAFVTAEEPNEI